MSSTALWILLATLALIILFAMLPRILGALNRRLQIGDHVRLHGGHQEPPLWLQGRPDVRGQVMALVIRNGRAGYEVVLDSPVVWNDTPYTFVLMQLRFKGARWLQSSVVAVELWASAPSLAAAGTGEVRHEYVESHAAYEVIKRSSAVLP